MPTIFSNDIQRLRKLHLGSFCCHIPTESSMKLASLTDIALVKRNSPHPVLGFIFAKRMFERYDLVRGRLMRGPAVTTEYSATTVIPPGKKFWADASENLIIKIK